MVNKVPTYKIVEGKLEKLLNDEKRPGHRYKSVCNSQFNNGEQYYVELTDEEERDRDKEEAEWEAKQPEREAEERRVLAESEKFRDSMTYETRIIAFVDILGWKEAILKTVDDSNKIKELGITLDFVEKFAGFIKLTSKMRQLAGKEEVKLTHFSDSIVISTRNNKEGWDALIWHLNGLISTMLMYGYFLRGGITVGDIIHREYLLFGPGLIAAYELESKKANYPRIIVDSKIPPEMTNDILMADRSGNILGFIRQWRIDIDGERFYDFIRPFQISPPIQANDKKRSLEPIRELIIQGLEENRCNLKVYSKYEWLANYFNVVLAEDPKVAIENIDLKCASL